MIELFDKTFEVIVGPSGSNENSFNYYHKSNRKDIQIIRRVLENWFKEFPEEEKKELKTRFKKDFDSAFYELFLFSLFKKLDFKIEIHPRLENSSKRPDFLISKDEFQAYVEAKVCFDKSDEEIAFEKRKNEFYDKLNQVRIKGFLLRIEELEFKTQKQPRTKELISKIEFVVGKLDRKKLNAEIELKGFDGSPNIEFENKDFKINIQPIPLIDSYKDKISQNPIGIYPIETFWGGGEDSLRRSILKKAKRYGKFKIPYLICLNALGKKTSSRLDIENVIWGTLKYTFSTNSEIKDGQITHERDGVFFNNGKARLTNVSGILVTKVFPSNIPISYYWLFENPYAVNKFDFERFKLAHNYICGTQIIGRDGNDLDEIFGISKDWLH